MDYVKKFLIDSVHAMCGRWTISLFHLTQILDRNTSYESSIEIAIVQVVAEEFYETHEFILDLENLSPEQ